MAEFLSGMAEVVGVPQNHAIAGSNTIAVERAKKVMANEKLWACCNSKANMPAEVL